jgi:hypothetical protein
MLDETIENPPDLWRRWQEADAQLAQADDAAHEEVAGDFELYRKLSEERIAPFCETMERVEEAARTHVPSTLEGVLLRVRLLKAHWGSVPYELHDDLLDRALEGLEAMAVAGG